MTVRIGRVWPNGGMPPIEKPVARAPPGRSRDACAARSGPPPGATVDPVGAADEDHARLQAVVAVGDEDEALDDLADLRAHGAAASAAVWVDSSK